MLGLSNQAFCPEGNEPAHTVEGGHSYALVFFQLSSVRTGTWVQSIFCELCQLVSKFQLTQNVIMPRNFHLIMIIK